MSTAVRWIIALLIVAALAWLVWWSGWLAKPMAARTQQTSTATTTQQQAQPQNGMSANNDTSDAAVSQDATAIDSQMNAYSSDSAAVDAGMNDQAVTQ